MNTIKCRREYVFTPIDPSVKPERVTVLRTAPAAGESWFVVRFHNDNARLTVHQMYLREVSVI